MSSIPSAPTAGKTSSSSNGSKSKAPLSEEAKAKRNAAAKARREEKKKQQQQAGGAPANGKKRARDDDDDELSNSEENPHNVVSRGSSADEGDAMEVDTPPAPVKAPAAPKKPPPKKQRKEGKTLDSKKDWPASFEGTGIAEGWVLKGGVLFDALRQLVSIREAEALEGYKTLFRTLLAAAPTEEAVIAAAGDHQAELGGMVHLLQALVAPPTPAPAPKKLDPLAALFAKHKQEVASPTTASSSVTTVDLTEFLTPQRTGLPAIIDIAQALLKSGDASMVAGGPYLSRFKADASASADDKATALAQLFIPDLDKGLEACDIILAAFAALFNP
jgi:hypothetical protein